MMVIPKFNRNKKTMITRIKKANLAINVLDCKKPEDAPTPASACSENLLTVDDIDCDILPNVLLIVSPTAPTPDEICAVAVCIGGFVATVGGWIFIIVL